MGEQNNLNMKKMQENSVSIISVYTYSNNNNNNNSHHYI